MVKPSFLFHRPYIPVPSWPSKIAQFYYLRLKLNIFLRLIRNFAFVAVCYNSLLSMHEISYVLRIADLSLRIVSLGPITEYSSAVSEDFNFFLFDKRNYMLP
jgi:hypothetical protein